MNPQGSKKPNHTTAMKQKQLTPAQSYASRVVEAIDNLLCDPENTEAADNVLMMVLERPKTLRCALAAYLYKSQMAQILHR